MNSNHDLYVVCLHVNNESNSLAQESIALYCVYMIAITQFMT